MSKPRISHRTSGRIGNLKAARIDQGANAVDRRRQAKLDRARLQRKREAVADTAGEGDAPEDAA